MFDLSLDTHTCLTAPFAQKEVKEETKSKETKPKSKKVKEKDKEDPKRKDKKKKKKSNKIWITIIFILSFILSAMFSFISELALASGGLITAFSIVLVLLCVNITFDVIGVAAASCDIEPFIARASRKDKSAQVAIKLLKNADKTSSVCNDVIGDICGIVSGVALGAILMILLTILPPAYSILYSIVLSSIVSALTVGGKAIGKSIAMAKNREIISFVAKILSFFVSSKKK